MATYLPPTNSRLTTKLDSDPNLMAAHQPPPYASSPTDDYSYPGSVAHPPSLGAGLPTVPEHEEVTPPLPDAGLPTVPEHEVATSADSQPVDPQAAIDAARYAAKGKAKVERRISGTARDVGNAVQKELQPVKRSLDPRE